MKFLAPFFALALFLGVLPIAEAQNADSGEVSSQTEIRAGEIALEGEIVSIAPAQLTLKVLAFQNPNGKRALLTTPKQKIIASKLASLFKVGQNIWVVGRDSGASKALHARLIVGVPPAVPVASTPIKPSHPPSLLPPQFSAGNLKFRAVQAGFDYAERVFPKVRTLERLPVFTCTFEVEWASGSELAPRVTLRRIVGPQSQFVKPSPINATPTMVHGGDNAIGFYSSAVNPNWEFIDMDVDIASTVATETPGGQIVVEDVPFPAPGGETLLNRPFVGTLGTKFILVKIKRNAKGDAVMIIHHERPSIPADLEVSSYQFTYKGEKAMMSGGGGLINGKSQNADNEIRLDLVKDDSVVKRLELKMNEYAPSTQNRATIVRQRLRFPLQELRQAQPPITAIADAPAVLGSVQNQNLSVVAESSGIDGGKDSALLLLWTQAPPEDMKRGIKWSVASGTATANGAPETKTGRWSNDKSYLWHVDATPAQKGEEVQKVSVSVPVGTTSYDLKLKMEGKSVYDNYLEREFEVPNDTQTHTPKDDGETSLILRKIQRFSRPEDLKNYPDWLRGQWPNAGIALVFEANPLLPDADFSARALDAEDDKGRNLRRGNLSDDTLYNIDVTQPQSNDARSKFYSLLVSQPAADATHFKVWLESIESSRNVKNATLEMKGVPFVSKNN